MEVNTILHQYGTVSSRKIAIERGTLYKNINLDSNDMDVYIINEKENTSFHFPINPIDEINVRYKKNYQTQEIVGQGEFDFHKHGKKIEEISFKVIIPDDYTEGFNRNLSAQSPSKSVEELVRYMNQEQAVRLIITSLPFNDLVFISDIDNNISAGIENCRLVNLKFRTHREIKVKSIDTSKQNKINKGLNKTDRENNKSYSSTYKVNNRKDCLWNIARAKLGKGSRWREIYNLNKDIIGPNPNRLKHGIVLKIPKR